MLLALWCVVEELVEFLRLDESSSLLVCSHVYEKTQELTVHKCSDTRPRSRKQALVHHLAWVEVDNIERLAVQLLRSFLLQHFRLAELAELEDELAFVERQFQLLAKPEKQAESAITTIKKKEFN